MPSSSCPFVLSAGYSRRCYGLWRGTHRGKNLKLLMHDPHAGELWFAVPEKRLVMPDGSIVFGTYVSRL